jgi:hypothetical protein
VFGCELVGVLMDEHSADWFEKDWKLRIEVSLIRVAVWNKAGQFFCVFVCVF